MRKSLLIATILALVVVVAGCGGSGDGDPANGDPLLDPNLVGTWQLFAATVNGMVTAPGEAMDWDEGVRRLEVEFGSDGAFTHRTFGADGSEIDSEDGTWSTTSGSFSIELGEEEPFAGTYQVQGNLLTVNAVEEGTSLVLRWVKVVTLTERDPHLTRTWLIDGLMVNGVATEVGSYFGWELNSDAAVLIFEADGTLTYLELEGEDIRGGAQGDWATGGGAIALNVAGELLRGSYAMGSATVTFLDGEGATVEFDLTSFVQEGSERDQSLIGLWQASSITVDGVAVPVGDFFNWEPLTTMTTIQLFADGTLLSIDYAGADFASGELNSWNTDGGVLTIVADDQIVMDAWNVVGDTATFTFSLEAGETAVLTLERL